MENREVYRLSAKEMKHLEELRADDAKHPDPEWEADIRSHALWQEYQTRLTVRALMKKKS